MRYLRKNCLSIRWFIGKVRARLMAGPVMLIIRDGWGINPGGAEKREENGNATLLASTPFHDQLYRDYPWSRLSASGMAEIPFLKKDWPEARKRFEQLLSTGGSDLAKEASQLIQYKILLTYLMEGKSNMMFSCRSEVSSASSRFTRA